MSCAYCGAEVGKRIFCAAGPRPISVNTNRGSGGCPSRGAGGGSPRRKFSHIGPQICAFYKGFRVCKACIRLTCSTAHAWAAALWQAATNPRNPPPSSASRPRGSSPKEILQIALQIATFSRGFGGISGKPRAGQSCFGPVLGGNFGFWSDFGGVSTHSGWLFSISVAGTSEGPEGPEAYADLCCGVYPCPSCTRLPTPHTCRYSDAWEEWYIEVLDVEQSKVAIKSKRKNQYLSAGVVYFFGAKPVSPVHA